jgi:hypothetical protein
MTAPSPFVFIPFVFFPCTLPSARTSLYHASLFSYRCYTCIPVSPYALPSVVVCFTFRTWYTVSYITYMATYPVPRSEYRICSPFDSGFPRTGSPSTQHHSLGPQLYQAGSASGTKTERRTRTNPLPRPTVPREQKNILRPEISTIYSSSRMHGEARRY